MYGELQLRLSQRVRTTEAYGGNGLDCGTCAPTMGDGASAFLQNTIWPLMRFGSARRLLLTVKNLRSAPGGPRWGCDVGCTCNQGGICLLWPGLSHPVHLNGVSPVTFCRRRRIPWPCLVGVQPLDDKALCARPAGWHGLCSLPEWRPGGESGGGRHRDRSHHTHTTGLPSAGIFTSSMSRSVTLT